MRELSLIVLTVLIVQAYSAPQLITLSDGKLGVNFAGYHAGVGLGGLAGGGGTAGGLYAEAGTPFGPAARAGLGGSVDGSGGPSGGLYAGATAGGNINAAAGLGGSVGGGKAVGGGFSSAQSGGNYASSHLGGESGVSGSSGFSISAHKSIAVPTTVIKETEVSVIPVEKVHKEIHSEVNIDAANEIAPAANAGAGANANINVNTYHYKEVSKWNGPQYRRHKIPPVQDIMSSLFRNPQKWYSQPIWLTPPQNNYITQVHVGPSHPPPPPPPPPKHIIVHEIESHGPPPPPPPPVFVHKHKPHRHHVHKTAYIGGYVSAGGEVDAPVSKTVVVKTVQPIEKRVDIVAEGGSGASISGHHGGSGNVAFSSSKEVVVSNSGKPSTFFQDIFNIPISTLKAVSGFLSNTAANTNVSIQKSASIQADSDSIASKHAPPSSSSSSDSHISVQTPSASQFIDGIFSVKKGLEISIPINTLSAVNKFLENNVAGKKRVQVTAEGTGEPTKIRLGPHARRRANKRVVIVQEPTEPQPSESK